MGFAPRSRGTELVTSALTASGVRWCHSAFVFPSGSASVGWVPVGADPSLDVDVDAPSGVSVATESTFADSVAVPSGVAVESSGMFAGSVAVPSGVAVESSDTLELGSRRPAREVVSRVSATGPATVFGASSDCALGCDSRRSRAPSLVSRFESLRHMSSSGGVRRRRSRRLTRLHRSTRSDVPVASAAEAAHLRLAAGVRQVYPPLVMHHLGGAPTGGPRITSDSERRVHRLVQRPFPSARRVGVNVARSIRQTSTVNGCSVTVSRLAERRGCCERSCRAIASLQHGTNTRGARELCAGLRSSCRLAMQLECGCRSEVPDTDGDARSDESITARGYVQPTRLVSFLRGEHSEGHNPRSGSGTKQDR